MDERELAPETRVRHVGTGDLGEVMERDAVCPPTKTLVRYNGDDTLCDAAIGSKSKPAMT